MNKIDNTFTEYLKPSQLCNFDEATEIKDLAFRLTATYSDVGQQVNCLFKFVKNLTFKYDDWDIKASDILIRGYGMCSGKVNLFVALMRSIGIPSRYMVMRCRGELELWDWMTRRSNELARIVGDIPAIGHHVIAEVYLDSWKMYDVARDPALEQGLVYLDIPIEFQPRVDVNGIDIMTLSNLDTWASERQESVHFNENRQEILGLINKELEKIRSDGNHNIGESNKR
jgi:hypothetical protein